MKAPTIDSTTTTSTATHTDVADEIADALAAAHTPDLQLTRSELAGRLGVSSGAVKAFLDGLADGTGRVEAAARAAGITIDQHDPLGSRPSTLRISER